MEVYIEKDNKYIHVDIQQSDSIYIILSDNIYFINELRVELMNLNIYCIGNNKRIVIGKNLNNEKINEIGGIEALINKCVDIINDTYAYINS